MKRAVTVDKEEGNKKMTLSEESREEYLKNKGNKCPFCKSNNMDADRPYINYFDDSIACRIHCSSCGKNWIDCYALTDIIVEDE